MAEAVAMLANLAFVAILADAALSDFRRFRIPNRDSALLLGVFVIGAAASGSGLAEVPSHLAAALALLLAGALLFILGIWGGGDVKLLAAVGAWTGFAGLPRLLLVMALAGGLLALVALVRRRWYSGTGQVPYGIAIAIGAVDWWCGAALPGLAGYLAS